MPRAKHGSSTLLMMAALGIYREVYPQRVKLIQSHEERQEKLKLAQDKRDRRNARRKAQEDREAWDQEKKVREADNA